MKNKIAICLALLTVVSCGKRSSESTDEHLDGDYPAKQFRAQVIGFHPYWNTKETYKNYRYNSLTAICYTSCELEPTTGEFKAIHDWLTTPIVDSAKAHGAKVYLGVTIKGVGNSEVLLSNEQAIQTSIKAITSLLKARDADGIVLHFENTPDSFKDIFSNYITHLHHALSDQNKTIIITVPGYDLNLSKYLDLAVLNSIIEYYILIRNDSEKVFESASPVAPLFNDTSRYVGSIQNAIQYYTNGEIPLNKLIVTIPYYGSKMEVENANPFGEKSSDYLAYQQIRKKYPQQVQYDDISKTAFINLKEGENDIQVWYDDANTLKIKYDYLLENGVGGISIWALGYDDGLPELWDLLDEKFIIKAN